MTRYLKQEIPAPSSESGRFTSVTWHPEKPLQILLTTKSWSTFPLFEKDHPVYTFGNSGGYFILVSLGDLRRHRDSTSRHRDNRRFRRMWASPLSLCG